MKVLVTCPPMLGMIDSFRGEFTDRGMEITAPDVVQTLSEDELLELVPLHDGWIIGDDPATRAVMQAGKSGRLKAAVKWGVGTDNVDFRACEELGISICNTPNAFGAEVADIALGYVIALARHTFEIDRGIRAGEWPKYQGISLAGRTVALVGFGDVGKNLALRLGISGMQVIVYDPYARDTSEVADVEFAAWPDRLEEADFIVTTCNLTESSRHMLNRETLARARAGVRVVNVSRGAVIDEEALIEALEAGGVLSAALDVFEEEPLPVDSRLRSHSRCIFGSHNASNTREAVERTSRLAVDKLVGFLGSTR